MVFPRNAQFQIKHNMMWGPDEHDQASLRHEDLEQNGPAVQPLDFPSPQVRSVSWKIVSVLDHRNRRVCDIRALVPSSSGDRMIQDGIDKHPSSDRAYLAKKKLSNSTYGSIRVCLVLKRRKKEPEEKASNNNDQSSVGWESTNELVVIKASMWCRIRMARTQLLEDPLKEAAALLLVGNYHKHVLGCSEVLQDETFLYTVLPYCAGGSLYTRILGPYNLFPSHGIGPNLRPDENRARVWFRQLLDSLFHLQKKGICHRDICLENLLLDKKNNIILVDFGLALRVPYQDPSNFGGVSDVSEGTCRYLIRKQGLSGNLAYLAPELIDGEDEFDGFAVDLWSAGIVLFVMLMGLAPFKWPNLADYRYHQINKGRLRDLLRAMDVDLSDDACHLLQNMMWRNPRKRFNLTQVMSHPWVRAGSSPNKSSRLWELCDELTPRSAYSPKRPAPFVQ